jgi:surface polysaccharide O-acyltransferase-like enzyme
VKKYILNADIIRVFAIFAVVGIHVLTSIYARPDFFGGKIWWFAFLLNCLFRVSVPLFVILSGYLVLGKPVTLKENLLRTVKRIVIPLTFFYLLLHLYTFLVTSARIELYDPATIFHNLNKDTYSYLYFLVILAFLYLLTPLFQLLFQTKNNSLIKYVIIFFFTNAVFATIARYTSLREGDVFHTYTMWLMWVGYFLYGQYVRLNQDQMEKRKIVNFLLFGGGYLLTTLIGYLSLSWHFHSNDALYIAGMTYPEEYLSIPVIMMSLAAFNLLITAKIPTLIGESTKFVKVIKYLSLLSFGLYLVHPLVMDFISKFCGVTADAPQMKNLVMFILLNALLTYGGGLLISAGINVVPGVRKIVGR